MPADDAGLVIPPEMVEALTPYIVEGQVPAWTELDERNLRRRVGIVEDFHPTEVIPLTGVVAIAGIRRYHRARCVACGLRRIVYAVEVNFTPSRRRCWSCWTGGEEA